MHKATVGWTWDAFSFAADLEYPLATFAKYLLCRSHLVIELNLEEKALDRFLLAVDESYAAPYMNPDPAAALAHNRARCASRDEGEDGAGWREGNGGDGEGVPRGAGVGQQSRQRTQHNKSRGGVPYHNVIHACDVLQSTYAYLYIGVGGSQRNRCLVYRRCWLPPP